METKSGIIKKPCKRIEIDGSETDILAKRTLTSIEIRDEVTDKLYRLFRTTNGMQMTGA